MATTERTERVTAKPAQNGAPTELIRVMLIDEHPLFRQGCRVALEQAGDCVIIAESSESRAGLELAKQVVPDVVLIDALLSTNDALLSWRCWLVGSSPERLAPPRRSSPLALKRSARRSLTGRM